METMIIPSYLATITKKFLRFPRAESKKRGGTGLLAQLLARHDHPTVLFSRFDSSISLLALPTSPCTPMIVYKPYTRIKSIRYLNLERDSSRKKRHSSYDTLDFETESRIAFRTAVCKA